MRTSNVFPLPITPTGWEYQNEQTLRRTIEQHLQNLRDDVIEIRDKTDKEASLSLRRHQFLLMGA